MRKSILLLAVFVLLPALSPAQEDSLVLKPGVFLVARQDLPDPRFRDSVILLLQHDQQGTVGLVVNRVSRLPLSSVLPKGVELSSAGKTLSYGGPVSPETLLTLVRVKGEPPEPSEKISEGLYLSGFEGLGAWQEGSGQENPFRIFAGYAGWAAGQLVLELEQGDWQVVAVNVDQVFADELSELWQRLRAD